MKLFATLHSHTTYSDGHYTPTELVRLAKDEGYGAVAITDHDTVGAWDEMKRECERVGMEYLFAAEFTAPLKAIGEEFHIVGFNFDRDYAPMREYFHQRAVSETYQTRAHLEKALELGVVEGVSWEEVISYNKGVRWICNEHVFRVMKSKGMATEADYWKFREAFMPLRRLVEPTYDFLGPNEIIKLIHDAGGIAVIAHPHAQLQYMDMLMDMGIDGVEVWHQMLTRAEKLEALALAERHGLYVSGGSDHQGILGGQYDRHPNPKATYYYAPECSLGTTKEFFDEIKRGRMTENRSKYFNKIIAKMTT